MTTIKTPSNGGLGKGNWKKQKTQLKAKFPVLTDIDLAYESGKIESMFTNLEKKLGITQDEIRRNEIQSL